METGRRRTTEGAGKCPTVYGGASLHSFGAEMTTPIKIDFVSDVSCPWCIIGLKGLEEALRRLGDVVDADLSSSHSS